jgi:hypothetical protein
VGLLYAHYEGFAKYCLELYIEYLCAVLKDCSNIPDRMFVYFVENEIRKAKSMTSDACFHFFKNDIDRLRRSAPSRMSVETESNLWPNLFAKLLSQLDLDSCDITIDHRRLTTLVARRNDIAHGKKVFVEDVKYYTEYESVVMNVMYELALAVVDRSGQLLVA